MLSLTAGSVCLILLARLGGSAFLIANQPPPLAARVGPMLTVAVASATALGGFVLVRSRPAALSALTTWADRLGPLIPLALLPGLLSRRLWHGSELGFLFVLGVVVVALEVLLRRALPAWRLAAEDGRTPATSRVFILVVRALLVLGILYYAVAVSNFTVLGHHRMVTATPDMAEFDNLFFNALHGHPFRAPATDGDIADGGALKVHAEFLLYLLLPLYALRPGPEALLVIQSVIVAATALPVYLLAARRLGEPTALVVALALLFMPAVQQPNFYDFHFVPLGMLCVAWTLYFADRVTAPERPRGFGRDQVLLGVCFTLALLSREDVSFGLIVLLGSGRAPALGISLSSVAFAYFCVVKFALMPHFGTMWFSAIYEDLKAPGRNGYGAVVATLLTNPAFVVRKLLSEARLLYVMHLTVPLAFLWLRRPWLLLAAVPGLPFTLLPTNRTGLQEISFQYVYHWIPYVFAASVVGLERLGPRGSAQRLSATVALVVGSYLASFQFGALLGARTVMGGGMERRLSITEAERERLARLRTVAARIPPNASVAATNHEGPHVSARLDFFSLHFAEGKNVDFILLDLNAMDDFAREDLARIGLDRYGLVTQLDPFVLLGRDADPKTLEPLMYRLRRRPGRR
jgi:uncharacterized membrane protein